VCGNSGQEAHSERNENPWRGQEEDFHDSQAAGGKKIAGSEQQPNARAEIGLAEEGCFAVWICIHGGHLAGRKNPGGVLFGQRLYVKENAAVDAVDDGVGPEAPVLGGPHFVAVEGDAFEAGVAVGEWSEEKIGALGLEVVVFEMADVNLAVGGGFGHEHGLIGDAEGKVFCGLPSEDRFLETAGREAAFAIGGEAFTVDAGFDGIGDVGVLEDPFGGGRQLGKGDDAFPDDFGRSGDVDGGVHLKTRDGRRSGVLEAEKKREAQEDGSEGVGAEV